MLKIKSKNTEKRLVTAEDLDKKYIILSEGSYQNHFAKLSHIEIIKKGVGIAVVRASGQLTGPWYANTAYSIDGIPTEYKPAYGLSKTVCGDVNFSYNPSTNQIIFTPKTDKALGTIISFSEMYFLAENFGGGVLNLFRNLGLLWKGLVLA